VSDDVARNNLLLRPKQKEEENKQFSFLSNHFSSFN
jgi:hypothetical protein